MAQFLNITIRINETGSSKIDEIIAKIKKLNESFQQSTLSPFQNGIENVNGSLQRVVSSVEAIQGKISSTISSIKGQTKDIADNTGARALEEANKSMETLLGRVGLVAVTVGIIHAKIGLTNFSIQNISGIISTISGNFGHIFDIFSILGTKLSLFKSNVNDLQLGYAIIGENLDNVLDVFSRIYNKASSLQSIYSFFLQGIPSFSTLFSGLYTASISLGGLLAQFAGGITYFFGFKFLLGEVSVLLRRVTGRGMESLSVLERGTRLINFFDEGLNRGFNSLGRILKIGGMGIFTYFSPLLGAIPLINSVTDFIMNRSRMFKDRVARFFGDGRASFTLILHDLRKLLTDILPGLIKIGERFAPIIKSLKNNEIDSIFQKILGIEKKNKGLFSDLFNFSKSPIWNYFKTIFSSTGSPIRSQTTKFENPNITPQVKIATEFKNILLDINKNLDKVSENLAKVTGNLIKAGHAGQNIKTSAIAMPAKLVPVLVDSKGKEILPSIQPAALKPTSVVPIQPSIKPVPLKPPSVVPVQPSIQPASLQNLFSAATPASSASISLFTILKTNLERIRSFIVSFKGSKLDIVDEESSKEQLRTDLKKIEEESAKDVLKEGRMSASLRNLEQRFQENLKKGMVAIPTGASGTRFEFEEQIQQLAKEKQGIFAFSQLTNPSTMAHYWDIVKQEFSKQKQTGPEKELTQQPDFINMVKSTANRLAQKGIPKTEFIKLAGEEAYNSFKQEIDKIYALYETSEKKISKSKGKEILPSIQPASQIQAAAFKQASIVPTLTSIQPASQIQAVSVASDSLRAKAVPVLQQLIMLLGSLEARSKGVNQSFNLIASIAQGSAGTADKAFRNLLDKLSEFFIKTNNIAGLQSLSKLNEQLLNVSKSGKEFAAGFDKSIVSNLEAALKNVKGQDLGGKLMHFISSGIKGGGPEVEKTVAMIAELIASYFPQSPAKAGALRALPGMGTKIPFYIAKGIEAGSGYTEKAIGGISEKIAKHFPRSLPLLGPLVGLVQMGIKIPFYIASGIESGLSFISNIMSSLTELIAEPLRRIREIAKIELLSKRTGVNAETISALGAAVEHLGGSASELDFIWVRIQETLSKTLTNEELRKFEKLGISIDSIKQSSDPAYYALENVADVIHKFGVGSKEAKEALDSFGIMNTSVLVNAMADGRKGLQETIAEISKFGGIIDGNTAKRAQSISMIESKIKKFKDYLINDFLSTILPQVEKISKAIFAFLDDNVLQIRTIVIVVAQSISNIANLIFKSLSVFIQSPGKVFDAIFETFKIFSQEFINSFGLLFSSIEATLLPFLESIWNFISNFVGNFFPAISKKIGLYIDLLWAKSTIQMYEFLPKIPEFLWSIMESIFNSIPFLWNSLASMLAEYFVRLEDEIFRKLMAVMTHIIAKMKGTVGEDLLRFMGMGGLFDMATQIEQSQEEISKAMDERTKLLKQKLTLYFSTLKQGPTPDTKLDEILEKIKNDKSLSEGWTAATKNLSSDLDKILEKAKNFGENLSKPEVWDKIKQSASKSLEEVKNVFAGLGLKEEAEQLVASLSPENFTDVLNRLRSQMQQPLGQQPKQEEEVQKGNTGFLDNLINLRPTFPLEDEGKKLVALGEKISEVWGGLGNVFNDFYEATGKKMRAFAIMAKGFSLMEAIVNVAVGVTKALSSLPPPLSFMQAASVSMAGGLQIAKIMSQGFAQGGLITEGTGPTSDDVLIRASKGEVVTPADTVKFYGTAFFEGIRRKMIPREQILSLSPSIPDAIYRPKVSKYAQGGIVSAIQSASNPPGRQPQAVAKQPQVNIINFTDRTELAKFMASSAGKDIMLNVIQNNSSAFRNVLGT